MSNAAASVSRLMLVALDILVVAGLAVGQPATPAPAVPAAPPSAARPNKEATVESATKIIKSIEDKKGDATPLSIKECIAIGLENNFDLEIERLGPGGAAEDVTAARAAFDPYLFSGTEAGGSLLSWSQRRQQTSARPDDPLSRQEIYSFGLGVAQPLQTGGTVMLGYDVNRADVDTNSGGTIINPYWQPEGYVAIRHSLLRGIGLDYNRAGIRIALNRKEISEQDFRNRALSVIYRIEEAYWNLVRANMDLRVTLKSLQVAMDNRRSSKLQVEAGTRPELDLTTADAGVASRLGAVILAEATVRDREDELKNLINLPRQWYLTELHIQPVDAPDEDLAKAAVEPDLSANIETAMRCRPEIEKARLAIDNAGLAMGQRKNELLPRVDLSAVLGYNGLEEDHDDAAARIGEFRYFRRGAQISLNYPIGNRAAASAHRRAKLDQRQAILQDQKARQDIIVQVRSAVRGIRTQRQHILTTRAARQLHRERLEAEQRKKEVGLATSYDVLNVEEDVVAAERDYVNALVNHQIALSNLDRQTGTLLDLRGIQLAPSGPAGTAPPGRPAEAPLPTQPKTE